MELLPEAFSSIVDYFDFDRLQREYGLYLPDEFFDHYLADAPEVLSELPEELRLKLTEGLQLESVVIQRPETKTDGEKRLILPPGSEPKKEGAKQLIFPRGAERSNQLILPEGFEPKVQAPQQDQSRAGFQRQGELEVPKKVAWQTLHERWRRLDSKTKRAVVKWKFLSAKKRAELAIDYAKGNIELKADLPEEEAKLFRKLYWSQDGDTLEFIYDEMTVISDPLEFYKDVQHLARRVGAEIRIFNPENSQNRSVSFHYHVSVAGKDLTKQAQALNRLMLIRRVSLGILNDLTGNGEYLYDPSAKLKGLIKVVNKNRFEVRTHHQPLQEELAFILSVVSLDKKAALEKIEHETKQLMTDYVVDQLVKYRLSYALDFEHLMTSQQKRRIQPQLKLGKWVDSLQYGLPSDFWERAPNILLSSSDPKIQDKIINAIQMKAQWPREFWLAVSRLLESPDSNVQRSVLYALHWRAKWPNEVLIAVRALQQRSQVEWVQQTISRVLEGRENGTSCLSDVLRRVP